MRCTIEDFNRAKRSLATGEIKLGKGRGGSVSLSNDNNFDLPIRSTTPSETLLTLTLENLSEWEKVAVTRLEEILNFNDVEELCGKDIGSIIRAIRRESGHDKQTNKQENLCALVKIYGQDLPQTQSLEKR
ncbi:MAG: hypothetical protein R3A80_07620 [Bdellovibrionota bacterium]